MGRWREAPEGLVDMAPPHLWGGGGEAAGGADPTSISPSQPVHNSLTTPGKDERCCKQISFNTKE